MNAIQVKSEQSVPRIIPERCIGCGSCIVACSPDAIEHQDSTVEVKSILKNNKEVAAIVDPTIAAEFPDITDYRKFVSMLRELGFRYILEGAFGVDLIAREYAKLIEDYKGKYYVFANDPVVVNYIVKFQPELIPNLAPLVNPAVASSLVARKKYGSQLKTDRKSTRLNSSHYS